jgi:mannosyltransferase OCH1-like enzyme
MIPEKIHIIAPSIDKWHPLWIPCYDSWHNNYDTVITWNDNSDLRKLVKDHLPEFLELYDNLPCHMMQIDFAKFAILYHAGGVYVDLDVFNYKNFHAELTEDLYFLEAGYGDYPIENAIVCSSRKNRHIYNVMLEIQRRFIAKNLSFPLSHDDNEYILSTTGPHMLSEYYENNNSIKTLSCLEYNNHGLSYNKKFKTKHLLTGIWGKDDLKAPGLLATDYKNRVKKVTSIDIDVDNFSFYKDYTKGNYLKNKKVNLNYA